MNPVQVIGRQLNHIYKEISSTVKTDIVWDIDLKVWATVAQTTQGRMLDIVREEMRVDWIGR